MVTDTRFSHSNRYVIMSLGQVAADLDLVIEVNISVSLRPLYQCQSTQALSAHILYLGKSVGERVDKGISR
mgnify:CR=1 FL=1